MCLKKQTYSIHGLLTEEALKAAYKRNNTIIEDVTPSTMEKHAQCTVNVKYRGKLKRFSVDTPLRNLITELWDNGIVTYNSCQGDENAYPYVHIRVPSSHAKYMKAIHIIRKFWRNMFIEIKGDLYNFGFLFYAMPSLDDVDCTDYTFWPYASESNKRAANNT